MQYKIIKDLNHEPLFTTNITAFDLGFIILIMVISLMFSFLVYPMLKIPYFLFCFFSATYLTAKSRTNPKRRNFQAIYYAITRNRYVYRRFCK